MRTPWIVALTMAAGAALYGTAQANAADVVKRQRAGAEALVLEVKHQGMLAGGQGLLPLPAHALEIEQDHAVVRMPIREDMVNGHDICHGGFVFTLADSTFALACNSRGSVTVASGADITFTAPSRLGDVLVAEARVRSAFGRSGITDVTVKRESDGQVVAEFRGRSRSLRTS